MMRSTPLRRSTPLQNKTPMRRSSPMRRAAGLQSGAPITRAESIKRHAPRGRRTAVLRRGSQAARDHMARVAALGCAICRRLGYGETPAQVHHSKEDPALGLRADDFDTVPLCVEHHNGPTGIHALKSAGFVRAYGISERDLIRQTQQELGYDIDD